MIKKGMNVGDVFEDGGGFYKVTAISGSDYISERISKEEYVKSSRKGTSEEEIQAVKAPADKKKRKTGAK